MKKILTTKNYQSKLIANVCLSTEQNFSKDLCIYETAPEDIFISYDTLSPDIVFLDSTTLNHNAIDLFVKEENINLIIDDYKSYNHIVNYDLLNSFQSMAKTGGIYCFFDNINHIDDEYIIILQDCMQNNINVKIFNSYINHYFNVGSISETDKIELIAQSNIIIDIGDRYLCECKQLKTHHIDIYNIGNIDLIKTYASIPNINNCDMIDIKDFIIKKVLDV